MAAQDPREDRTPDAAPAPVTPAVPPTTPVTPEAPTDQVDAEAVKPAVRNAASDDAPRRSGEGTEFVPNAPTVAPVLTAVAPEGADGEDGGSAEADVEVASGMAARLRMTWWTLDWRAKAAVAALVVAVIMAVGALSYGVWRNAALHIITEGPTPLSWRTDAADNDLSSAQVFGGEAAQENEEQGDASDASGTSGTAGAKSSGSASSHANGGASVDSSDSSDASDGGSGDASDDAGDKPTDGGSDKPSDDLTEDDVQWTGYY